MCSKSGGPVRVPVSLTAKIMHRNFYFPLLVLLGGALNASAAHAADKTHLRTGFRRWASSSNSTSARRINSMIGTVSSGPTIRAPLRARSQLPLTNPGSIPNWYMPSSPSSLLISLRRFLRKVLSG